MKQSIVVTGAFGGMGFATCQLLKQKGFRVFALDKTIGQGTEDIIPIQADLTDEQSVQNALEVVKQHTDQLKGIIHFAGVYMLDSLVEMDSQQFEKIFKINLGGVYLVNKHFLPLLKQNSRIIITTSELASLDP